MTFAPCSVITWRTISRIALVLLMLILWNSGKSSQSKTTAGIPEAFMRLIIFSFTESSLIVLVISIAASNFLRFASLYMAYSPISKSLLSIMPPKAAKYDTFILFLRANSFMLTMILFWYSSSRPATKTAMSITFPKFIIASPVRCIHQSYSENQKYTTISL